MTVLPKRSSWSTVSGRDGLSRTPAGPAEAGDLVPAPSAPEAELEAPP
jgi:hypothetical protein